MLVITLSTLRKINGEAYDGTEAEATGPVMSRAASIKKMKQALL